MKYYLFKIEGENKHKYEVIHASSLHAARLGVASLLVSAFFGKVLCREFIGIVLVTETN